MIDHTFGKEDRLRCSEDFDRVYHRRRSVADGLLIMYGCENNANRPRLGLTVSRKVGNAVRRNRWKRVLREAFRLNKEKMPSGIDLVVSPCRGAQPDFHTAQASMIGLAKRVVKKLERDRR